MAMGKPWPIPWVVRWSGEASGGFVAPCPYSNDRPAIYFPDRQGEGTPNYKAIHFPRRRKALAENRCEVCGNVIEGDAFIFPVGGWIDTDEGERSHFVVMNGLTCRSCVSVAQDACPVLRAGNARAGKSPLPEERSERFLAYSGKGSIRVVQQAAIILSGAEYRKAFGRQAPIKV